MNNRPIGIFDSGIGGLTVLKEIKRVMYSEDIVYLGDTARVPYGIRSPETVTRYAFECIDFLIKKGIKFLVIACNTVSATCLNEIKKSISIPVVGVIEPGAISAVSRTKNKKIGVIGTEATIRSNAYTKAIKHLDSTIDVFGLPCPLFVPLVEEGWTEGEIAKLVADKYLKEMKNKEVDTLVLGCTHYPLLKNVIREVMGDVFLVDSAIETANVVKSMLENIENNSTKDGSVKFYVTDSPEKFISVGERFLEDKINYIEKINLLL
jgi:glutamate racemase